MKNLLRNGDFETDWSEEKSHRCLVLPIDGKPYETDIGNIFTPSGDWTTWFVHDPGTWDQPEVRDAHQKHDPHRVHSGKKATLLFTFWRKHHAGFYQPVQVTPGAKLSLSVYAHAWSNTNIPGHADCTDKARCSAGVGTEAIAIRVADAPPLSGDPWDDALQNFAFCIGIDPTGGTNPLAESVQWGEAYYSYNNFYRLTAQTIAQANTITVFLRSVTQWPFKHNDAYWDDAILTQEVEEMRGDPRLQYKRTYILLPPDADPAWARAAVKATWAAHRFTIGGSADDAGIGDLDFRRIVAVNPQNWPGKLAEFYGEFYPGIEYIPLQAATPQALIDALKGM